MLSFEFFTYQRCFELMSLLKIVGTDERNALLSYKCFCLKTIYLVFKIIDRFSYFTY